MPVWNNVPDQPLANTNSATIFLDFNQRSVFVRWYSFSLFPISFFDNYATGRLHGATVGAQTELDRLSIHQRDDERHREYWALKLQTVSGWPALLSSLCNRRWRRILFLFPFFVFFFCLDSFIRSGEHQQPSILQSTTDRYEKKLQNKFCIISVISSRLSVDLCSNSSRTRLPSHHLTANGSIECGVVRTTATGFAAGASFVRLRSHRASHFFFSCCSLRSRRRCLSVSFLYSICRWHVFFLSLLLLCLKTKRTY